MAPKPESAPKKTPSIHSGHRKRMKTRYRDYGQEVFDDHQLLELLLFYAIPQGDVNPLAHRLLNRFHSLDQVIDAPISALTEVEGMGEHTALLLHLVKDLARRYQMRRNDELDIISTTQEAADYLEPYFMGANQELIYLLSLDQKGKVLQVEQLGQGSFNSVTTDFRQLLNAVLTSGASQVILAHNHTSGVALPSSADIAATQTIARTLKSIQVTLSDHLIFSDGDYISLKASSKLYGIF